MATSTREEAQDSSKFASLLKQRSGGSSEKPPVRKRRRIPRWITLPLGALVVLGIGLAAAYPLGWLSPTKGGREVLTEKTRRADLTITITEDGNVESSHNVDIKCEVKGGSTILWLIKDGTQVKKGDELARLDSSSIEDQVNAQKILYEKANAAKIDAEKVFKAAEISVQEYVEGTFLQSIQSLKANATVAKENLESAKNNLQYGNRMLRKGYITSLQRDAQAFAEQRATLDLNVAQTAIEVLEKFTKAKTVVGLESTRDSAKARMASEEAAFELEKDRLERLQTQLEKCTIVAPDDGMVVYANEQMQFGRGGGSSQQSVIEEGAMVRERQSIIKLPDLTQMQVKCTVHESKVDMLRPGMRARVRIQDRDFQGTVLFVANQAEPTNFFTGSVKEYATIVKIDSDTQGLRPGMTSAVEILVANLHNALSVPVQAVVEIGGKFYCWTKTPLSFQKHSVVLGMSNNTRIEIKDGLSEQDEVLLNPRAVIEEAREEVLKEEAVDVKKKFGDDKPKEIPKGEAPGGAGKRSAGGARPQLDFKSLDKDGDGKLTVDEVPERMKAFFDTMDTNGDKSISQAELAEVRKKMQEMQRQNGGPGGAGGPGGPGGP